MLSQSSLQIYKAYKFPACFFHWFHHNLTIKALAVTSFFSHFPLFPHLLSHLPLLSSGLPEVQEFENGSQVSESLSSTSVLSHDERSPVNFRAESPSKRSSSHVPNAFASFHHSPISPPSSSVPISSQNSSSVTPKASPVTEKLPYVPHSPFHLFSYDLEEHPTTMKEKETEGIREHR